VKNILSGGTALRTGRRGGFTNPKGVGGETERVAIAAKAGQLAADGTRKRGLRLVRPGDLERKKRDRNRGTPLREKTGADHGSGRKKRDGHVGVRKKSALLSEPVCPFIALNTAVSWYPLEVDNNPIGIKAVKGRPDISKSGREQSRRPRRKGGETGKRVREEKKGVDLACSKVV